MPINLADYRDADGNPYVPQTFDEAVSFLHDQMADNERQYVRDNGARHLHFSLGMSLRNEWNLWELPVGKTEVPLVRDTVKRFGCHPGDDVSDHILRGLEEKLGYQEPSRDEPIDPTKRGVLARVLRNAAKAVIRR